MDNPTQIMYKGFYITSQDGEFRTNCHEDQVFKTLYAAKMAITRYSNEGIKQYNRQAHAVENGY